MASQNNLGNIKTQQEEEVEALQAIYDDDFEDLRKKDVWKVWRPGEFLILLYPSKEGVSADAQVYASLRMYVKFTETYPVLTLPLIEFWDEKGLSKNDVQALKQRVDEKAASLLGEAMICDLCQYVQEYLHTKNHPPDYQSFYEGMIKNQRRREIVDEDMRRRMEEEQRERDRVEMEAIETELRRRHEQRKHEAMQRRISKTRKGQEDEEEVAINIGDTIGDRAAAATSGVGTGGRSRSTSLPPSPMSPSTNAVSDKRKGLLDVIRDETAKTSSKLHTGFRLTMTVKGQDCTVVVGLMLGSSHQCHADFVGVIEETGQTVIISEWCLKLKRNNAGKIIAASLLDERTTAFQKELQALEQEFRGLVKLDHPKLLKYLSLLIFDIHQSPPPADIFRLVYLKEHSSSSYCAPVSHFLRRGFSVSRDYLRNLAKDILSALDYLHSRATLHKDLNEDCIWDTGGADGFLLSDFSLRKRILDLIEMYQGVFFDLEHLEQENEGNESRRMIIGVGKMSRKSEVFTLGVCLLKLAIGPSAFRKMAGRGCGFIRIPEDESIFHFGDTLKNFIEKMIIRDDEQRWSCSKLLTHPFLTLDTGAVDEKRDGDVEGRHSMPDGVSAKEDNEDKDVSAALRLSYPLLGCSTRLETEFDVLKLLGRGGFGDVMKVKNKLDDCIYAIKRIILNPKSKELNKKITREVKLLSRLNHENVVRYYNSWIEQRVVEKTELGSNKASSTETTSTPSVVNARTRVVRTLTPTRPVASQPRKNQSPTTVRKNVLAPEPEQKAKTKKKGGLGFDEDDVENLAPPPAPDESAEWSVSFDPESVEDSSSEDDDDVLGNLFYSKAETNLLDDVSPDKEVGDLVVFENGGSSGKVPATVLQQHSKLEEKSGTPFLGQNWEEQRQREPSADVVQVLYIQMEYCQKSTLRQAIDYGELVDDRRRAWRLFREILEGLSYIHHQGMIHRDLKPVNIFLDSHDHVKIGDFGLATKLLATISGQDATYRALEDISQSGGGDWANLSHEMQSELTTKIGTALYVSPELCPSPKPATSTPTTSKIAYTQKVDMYSLGIVLFEMFYRPLTTGMERIKLLTDLRRPEIVLPSDFVKQLPNEKPVMILQSLLQHDADRRPTADELLHSDLLPAVEMQPSEFQLAVKQTLSNTQTHQYKWLINVLLDEQFPSSVQEYVYDADMYDLGQFSAVDAMTRQWVEEKLVDLFRTYGAVCIDTPLLLPKSKILTEHAETRVDVMDRSGSVLHLPYDLRVPFARYAVRSQIVHLKRYCISMVYRDEKRSSHPRQLTECAFDVVTNVNGCTLAAAEILALASDIVSQFPVLRSHDFSIKLNHTSILKAILLYSGVEDLSSFLPIMELLASEHGGRSAAEKLYKRHQKLKDEFRLSDKCISQIVSLMQLEGPLTKIASVLRCITKKKDSPASSLAKEGLHELETIQNSAETLGSSLPVVVSLSLLYNLHEYDGPVFQLVGEVKRMNERKNQAEKSNKKSDVRTFAAGGRYDHLLNQFRKPARFVKPLSASSGALVYTGGNAPVQGAVGISFAFDLIVQMVASATNRRRVGKSTPIVGVSLSESGGSRLPPIGRGGLSPYDILVCSVGHKLMLKEKLGLVRSLRLARLKADFLQEPVQNLEDLQDFCSRIGIGYLIIMKDAEAGVSGPGSTAIRVRYWDKAQERMVDKRLALLDVVSFIQEKYQEENGAGNEDGAPGGVGGGGCISQYEPAGDATMVGGSLGSSGIASSLSTTQVSNNLSNLKVHFAVLERPPHNVRKRIEGQIGNILSPVLQKFSPRETLELIATDLPGSVVKQLASMGDFNRDEGSFRASVADVVSRFNKHKKELRLLVDLICDLKFFQNDDHQQMNRQQQQGGSGSAGVMILYSYADDCYRFIL